MHDDPDLQVQFSGMEYFPRRPTLREVFAQANPRGGLQKKQNRKEGEDVAKLRS